MAELRKMLEKLGCTSVQTYVQSGNAVFRTTRSTAALTEGIEAALARTMGRPIATTLRTQAQLEAVLAGNPFGKVANDPAFLCVTFLSQPPKKPELAPLYARSWKPELFEVTGKEIYAWYPNGQGKSPLAAAIAKLKLRGAVTTRNWNTVQKLVQMLGEG
jgi:uncharacterized protein (DUF1697 family)